MLGPIIYLLVNLDWNLQGSTRTSFFHHEGPMMTKTLGRLSLLILFNDIPMSRNVYLQQSGAQRETLAFLVNDSRLRTQVGTGISSTILPHVHLPLLLQVQAYRRLGPQHKPVLLGFLLSTMFLLHGRERRWEIERLPQLHYPHPALGLEKMLQKAWTI
jgi:hypothetical protein